MIDKILKNESLTKKIWHEICMESLVLTLEHTLEGTLNLGGMRRERGTRRRCLQGAPQVTADLAPWVPGHQPWGPRPSRIPRYLPALPVTPLINHPDSGGIPGSWPSLPKFKTGLSKIPVVMGRGGVAHSRQHRAQGRGAKTCIYPGKSPRRVMKTFACA